MWRVSSMIAIFKLTAHWVFVKDWLCKHDASLPRMPPSPSGQRTQTKYTFKTFGRCPVRLLNVLCTSCAQGGIVARLKWYFPIVVCYFLHNLREWTLHWTTYSEANGLQFWSYLLKLSLEEKTLLFAQCD